RVRGGGHAPPRPPPDGADAQPDERADDGKPGQRGRRRVGCATERGEEGQGAAHQRAPGESSRSIRPATTSRTSSATAATDWLSSPSASRKRRPSSAPPSPPRPTPSHPTPLSP